MSLKDFEDFRRKKIEPENNHEYKKGRPRKKTPKKIQTAVALTPEMHKIISDLAKTSYRSITGYIEMVLIEHFEKIGELEKTEDGK